LGARLVDVCTFGLVDTASLSETVSLLQLLLERPRFHQRRGTVRVTAAGDAMTVEVVMDRWTGHWELRDKESVLSGEPGRYVPPAVALLAPEHLPVWGRSHDSWDPVHTERRGQEFTMIAANRYNPVVQCEVSFDARYLVATTFKTPAESVDLVQQSAIV